MIVSLQGKLLIKEPTRLVVQAGGIGFELKVPLSTSRQMPQPGAEVNILVVMRLTPAGVELFGFADPKEQEVFELLTSVKGVGAKAALNFLSRFEPEEVQAVIAEGREEVLRSVPGIGPKKAAGILRQVDSQLKRPIADSRQQVFTDAVKALLSLGLSRKEAEERVRAIRLLPEMSLEEVLKIALTKKR